MAALTLLNTLRENNQQRENELRDFQRQQEERQRDADQRALQLGQMAHTKRKDILGALGTEMTESGRSQLNLVIDARDAMKKEEEAGAALKTLLPPAQQRASAIGNVNTADFGGLVSQLALAGGDAGLSQEQLSPGLASLSFFAQAAEAENAREERERTQAQRRTLEEILAQQRATTYLGVRLNEELQDRQFALKTAEEQRFAETSLGIVESQEERAAALKGREQARSVFNQEFYSGRKLSQDMAIDQLAKQMVESSYQEPTLVGHRGKRVPARQPNWDEIVNGVPELRGLPYAKQRAVDRAAQIKLADAPRLEVLDMLKENGVNPSIVPNRLIRALQPGETSNGRYIPPSAFLSARTGLPMPMGLAGKDKGAVEEMEDALAHADTIEAAVLELRDAKGDVGRIERVKEWTTSYFQTGEGDPNASFLVALGALDASLVAKGVSGESGNLAATDVGRAYKAIPNVLEALAKDERKYKSRILAMRMTAMNRLEGKYRQSYRRADYLPLLKRSEQSGVAEKRTQIREVLGVMTAPAQREIAPGVLSIEEVE